MSARDASNSNTLVGDHALRVEHSLTELNTRIAVLAHVLGADLGSEADIDHILNRENQFFRLQLSQANEMSAGERRLKREWEELRGLLALRCDLMAQTVNELGIDAARLITLQVQARRDKEGLPPDSDGFHLRHRLNPSADIPPEPGDPK